MKHNLNRSQVEMLRSMAETNAQRQIDAASSAAFRVLMSGPQADITDLKPENVSWPRWDAMVDRVLIDMV